jgi:16S rRNA (guanine527-N7)-methyltransferase
VKAPQDFVSRESVSRESMQKLELYVDLLLTWQARINLISPTTIPQIWERHVADSLQLLAHIPPETRTIADLGSGAGLPGLVLACCGGWTVHLYEANHKKSAFLNEALRVTGSKGVVHSIRLEELPTERNRPVVDIVTARALAPLPLLLDYAEPFFKTGARGLFHKGRDVDLELTQAQKYWRIDFKKHASPIDSDSFLLDVKEITHVAP